jgi:hypothetical protein
MASNSTTWAKGEKPPVQKPKGSKHKRTIMKEMLGVKSWSEVQEFLETKGVIRYLEELDKMKGKDYTTAFTALAEFFRPKLARSATELSSNSKITIEPITGIEVL